MKTKGFTLIELLVVIVIIGILVAIALPNFIKIKDKAKEAEVKQNLHSIQLAVERYATDTGGNYPYFLFGGDTLFNAGTANAIYGINGGLGTGNGPINGNWQLPFDMFNWVTEDSAWTYADGSADTLESGDLDSGWGDTLEYEAYMTKYPRNPFVIGDAARQFSYEYLYYTNMGDWGGWGGKSGELMFNTGPWGDMYTLVKTTDLTEQTYLQLPGNFYYHPRFGDGVSDRGHQIRQAEDIGDGIGVIGVDPLPLDDSDDVSSLDVAGYDLAAYGSARTKGQDIDNAIVVNGAAGTPVDFLRTGYFTLGQERNPFVHEGDYPDVGDYDERPFSDGRPDFIIIHLSSGIDRKIQDNSREG